MSLHFVHLHPLAGTQLAKHGTLGSRSAKLVFVTVPKFLRDSRQHPDPFASLAICLLRQRPGWSLAAFCRGPGRLHKCRLPAVYFDSHLPHLRLELHFLLWKEAPQRRSITSAKAFHLTLAFKPRTEHSPCPEISLFFFFFQV